ncbi:MAG: peptidylprolyl isomerase, partial [Chromatiales bacterium]|nr:peptidylprolyl isomerase [Chromatiales bacterium]
AQLQEQEIRNKIRVSDQEVDTYITQNGSDSDNQSEYHLSHILIATPEGASPSQIQEAQAKAAQVVEQLRAGDDFKTTALSLSDGSRALEGGDLGWRPGNQLPTIFARTVKAMNIGETSDPIRSPSGYHIIRLNDRKGGERHMVTQTKVRHILVHTNEVTSDNDARTRLGQLRTRIQNGEDFSSLARSHSDDKSSALKGGDLGWTSPGDLLAQFDKAIENLSSGAVTEPFRTDLGWHLAQVLERREFDNTSTVQRATARAAIIKRKMAEENELYLRRLRDEAYIDIRLDDI